MPKHVSLPNMVLCCGNIKHQLTNAKVSPKGPLWVDDRSAESCFHCSFEFSMLIRRHHCRHCGQVFCRYCCSDKHMVAKFGYMKPVRLCRKCNAACLKAENLLSAVNCNDIAMVQRFVRKGIDVNSYTDVFPPLTVAAKNGYLEIVKMLLDAGADPNQPILHSNIIIVQCSRCRKTSHFDGTSSKDYQCPSCDALTKLESSCELDQHGVCALHAACMTIGNVAVVKALLAARADALVRTAKGRTPLMYVAAAGFVDCARLLLQVSGDLNASDAREEDTALHMAVRNGHTEMVEVLVAAGAKLSVTNLEGMTALQLAEHANRTTLIDLLSGSRTNKATRADAAAATAEEAAAAAGANLHELMLEAGTGEAATSPLAPIAAKGLWDADEEEDDESYDQVKPPQLCVLQVVP